MDVRVPAWLHTAFVYFFPVPSPNSRDFVCKLAQLAIHDINVDMVCMLHINLFVYL